MLSAFITAFLAALGFSGLTGAIAGFVVAIISVVVLIVGLIYLLLSWGLWSGKNWARIIWIIFAVLGALFALSTIAAGGYVAGIINLIIDALIIYYLTRPHVAAYFKHMVMVQPTPQPMSK